MERKDHITSTGYQLHSSPHFLYVEQLNLSFFLLEGWEHIFYAFFDCRGTFRVAGYMFLTKIKPAKLHGCRWDEEPAYILECPTK